MNVTPQLFCKWLDEADDVELCLDDYYYKIRYHSAGAEGFSAEFECEEDHVDDLLLGGSWEEFSFRIRGDVLLLGYQGELMEIRMSVRNYFNFEEMMHA